MANVNISLALDISIQQQNVENNYVITGVTANGLEYIEISQFCNKYQISDSTIRRRLKCINQRNSKYFIKVHNKIYLHPDALHHPPVEVPTGSQITKAATIAAFFIIF